MSKRSPVLGYNHNFKHRGLIFHVQTEDSGVDNPHLFTHLFHGGVIISSRKVDYDAESAEDIVKSLMQSQHRAVLKDLKIGTFDSKIDAYLGDKEDLLPRKADSASGPADATAATDAATAPTDPLTPAPESEVDATASTEPLTPIPDPETQPATAPTVPASAFPSPVVPPPIVPHSGAISLDGLGSAIPQVVADSSSTIPNEISIDGPIELEAPLGTFPKNRHEREPIPTPIAMPIVSPNDLGDPIVTFNQTPVPPSDIPELPNDAVGERSATYSIARPNKRKRAETQARNTGGPARAPQAPEPGSTSKPSGKAANPQPGMRRSSVVVSRPAVIIGAPARSVGGDASRRNKRRTPSPRKSRSKDLFGNDTISEKSLDEVIMAYLSEDGSDE